MFKKIAAFFKGLNEPKSLPENPPGIKPEREIIFKLFWGISIRIKNGNQRDFFLSIIFMAMVVVIIYLLRRPPS